MATAKYLRGDQTTIEYLCPTTAAVVVNQILVVGTNEQKSLGVAANAIPTSTVGIVNITGCYLMPKVTGAAIKAGETVDWDASSNACEDNQSSCVTGDLANIGVALADAAAGASSTTVKVWLKPGTVKTA